MKILKIITALYIGSGACLTGCSFSEAPIENSKVKSDVSDDSLTRNQGEMKGIEFINKNIRNRLFDATDVSSQRYDISTASPESIRNLRSFLGIDKEDKYLNGIPSPFSLLLWHQVAANFAGTMGSLCEGTNGEGADYTLNTDSKTAVNNLCEWSDDAEKQEQYAKDFWDIIIWDDDPKASDLQSFIETFVTSEEGSNLSKKERVEKMVTGVILLPAFLLAK
jgi:hypothetical protein